MTEPQTSHPVADASTAEKPLVTFTGLDHHALAARTRRSGWLQFARYKFTAESPYLAAWFVTALGNPVLYLAAMGLGLGALVRSDVSGVGYLAFIAPGLLVATVSTTAAMFGTWPVFGGFKWQKSYLAGQASPLEPAQMAQGEALALGVRLVAQAFLFWLLGNVFQAWGSPWSVVAVPVGALAGLAMFTPLMAYSATLQEEGLQFNFVNRLIVMPMFLFAGTFFPLESMPPYLQWIGWISPMWHGTQLARVASFGLPLPAWQVAGHLGVLLACAVGGLLAAQRTFTRRLVA